MRIIIYLGFGLTLVLTGCSLFQDDEREFYFGSAGAQMNGQTWTANRAAAPSDGTGNTKTLIFDIFEGKDLTERLGFGFAFKGAGTYTSFQRPTSYIPGILGGDVGGMHHYLLESADNVVVVSSYNPETGDISGTFQATFVLDEQYAPFGLVDTVRFTNGRFNTKIIDWSNSP